MKIRLILKCDPVQIGEDEFYNPWKTVDLDIPDDLIDVEHEYIVGAVAYARKEEKRIDENKIK